MDAPSSNESSPRSSPPPGPVDDDAALAETHAAAPPTAGARHFHHYEVCLREDGVTLHELGRGAMGVSYKARDINLDTPVAIKVISTGLSGYIHARERFRREARAAAQLRHPNVASVFHFGDTADGRCFYAMEYIDGETLSARVRREGPLPAAFVVEIASQVTAALIAANEQGLVHRDLKPANIMLVASRHGGGRASTVGDDGAATPVRGTVTVKVIDFGLAKAVGVAEPVGEQEDPLTRHGGFLGTPAYASPEQSEGGEVDTRSDIYSLGVTLWYALTGKVPFTGRTAGEIYDRQVHRALPVAQLTDLRIPAPLVQLLTSMLAVDRSRRPASPGVLHAALERCRLELGEKTAQQPVRDRAAAVPGKRRKRKTLLAFCVVSGLLLAGGAGTGVYLLARRHASPAPEASPDLSAAAAPEKSIAVLPLEDLSEDKSNAYFADGIQDDLLSSLTKIKDLKVISRSSVMGYRNAAVRDLREIGRQLGVATILEGSVRRAPARVLVNVALIDTRNGLQIWAEHYDRTLEDSLTLQGELAMEIAAALRATLSPEEKVRVNDRLTDNPDAYVLYLRGRESHTRPTLLLQDMQSAADLYTQAVALDPSFSAAHAQLSAALAFIYLNYQPTPEIKARARAEADEALRLRPDSGEGHLGLALCLYWTEKNYEAALVEMATAARLLPGNAVIDFYSGAIRRRQGRWREGTSAMRQALARDPRSAMIAREIVVTDCLVRDWAAAAHDGKRTAALAADLPLVQVEKNWVDVWQNGNLAPLRADLAAVPPGVDPDGGITIARWDTALVAQDFAEAERVVASRVPDTVVSVFGPILPKSYLFACIAAARGETARARDLFEAARPMLEEQARNYPLDPFRQAQLGLVYADLGRKEDALRCGRRAVEILPEEKDAVYGACLSGMIALIYTRAGETDQAMALIERLLTAPGPVFAASEGSITLSDLRLRWRWDPLRKDPRFRALLAGPEPKTVYK